MKTWPERKTSRARIEIIPMIDVMMFLLVFFVLISTNVLPAMGLKIAVPHSGAPDKIVDRVTVTVGITREGTVFVDGAPTAVEALAEAIRRTVGDKPAFVVVASDEGAQIQALVSVLDSLKVAGVTGAQIITRPR